MHASLPRLAIRQTYLVSMVITFNKHQISESSSITRQKLDGKATPKPLITIIAEQILVFSDPLPF